MSSLLLFAQQQPTDGGAGAFVGGLLSVMAVFWVLAVVASIFWLWMLIDVVTSNRDTNEKILWFLVVFFLHILGALIYFFVARSHHGPAVARAT